MTATHAFSRSVPSLCAVALAVFAASCTKGGAESDVELWIRNVQVIDTNTGVIARDRAIAISRDTIVAITADDDIPVDSDARMIDGAGAYAVPGLWDTHAHLMQDDRGSSLRRAARMLGYGITHVRDMGASLANREAFLKSVQSDTFAAPVIVSSGPAFWAFATPYGNPQEQILADDSASTVRAVNIVADAGVDLIKVYAGFTPDRMKWLIESATRRGLGVAGHAQPGATLAQQALMGLRTVEHLDFSTLEECAASADGYFERVIAARFRNSGEAVPAIYGEFAAEVDNDACRDGLRAAAEAGLVLTPTLVTLFMPYVDAVAVSERLPGADGEMCRTYLRDFAGQSEAQRAALPAAGRRLMRVVLDAGLPVMAGSDSPAFCSVEGESLLQELALLEEAGLSPLEVLQAATTLPARTVARDSTLGLLAPGAQAHVVLLRANPLESALAYRRPIGLYTRGEWRDEGALLALRAR